MIIGGALQLHRRAGRAQAPARCERLSSGEHEPVGAAWSEGHLLSMVGSQLIGGLIRRAGGASFQELNLTVDDTAAMSSGGADLCHDFTTRPTYHQAILLSRPRHALGRARRPRSRRWRPSHDLEGRHLANPYGPIHEQLQDPTRFARQLDRLPAVRHAYGVHASHQAASPDVTNPIPARQGS
jgi:hypothetical protein